MIDTKPAIGRHLFRTGVISDTLATYCGKITKVTPKGVSFESEVGKNKGFIYNLSVECVCDTAEEVEKIRMFSHAAYQQLAGMHSMLRSQWEQLIGETR